MKKLLIGLSIVAIVLIGIFGVRWYKITEEQKQAGIVVQSYLEELSKVSYQQSNFFSEVNKYQIPSAINLDSNNQIWFYNRVKDHRLIGKDIYGIKLVFKGNEGKAIRMEGDAFFKMYSDKTGAYEVVQYSQDFYMTQQLNGKYLITAIMPNNVATKHL